MKPLEEYARKALLDPMGALVPERSFDFIAERITDAIRAAINDKLEEVEIELQKLEEGVYTSAQTPAGLVRAMKVR